MRFEMKLTIGSILLGTALVLSGCSGDSNTDEAAQITNDATSEPVILSWEDLMPEGEEALLAEMYTEYYEDLESRMIRDAQRLQDVTPTDSESFDITTIAEGSANDTMEQIGTFNVVSDLDGMNVRIPGYIVPLDFSAEAKHTEFLLVPYFGACLHTPPPPPNQIIFVNAEPAAEVANIYEPFWAGGYFENR